MTEKRIYELAWNQQIQIWGKEREILDRMPDNELSQIREANAKAQLRELEAIMKEKGFY